jgi:protein-L-isoaspartate(D-aspartate) O-methyltransferase
MFARGRQMNPNNLKRRKIWFYQLLCLLLVTGGIAFVLSLHPNQSQLSLANQQQAGEKDQAGTEGKGKTGQKAKEAGACEHKHEAFKQRRDERVQMVEWQIRRRDVRDPNVLEAMLAVPRHAFVRRTDLRRAYDDNPLPIGFGQTISQPYIVGYMTEALKLAPEFTVLEIGTGSGYQAAVCAEIAKQVYTIEIIEQLAQNAEARLKELGYSNVWVKAGDGYFGWPERGPFDAIIVTAAAGLVPPTLIEQLKPGGRLILPLGSPYGAQTLVLVTKDKKGIVSSESLLPVRFVPMVRHITEAGQQKK